MNFHMPTDDEIHSAFEQGEEAVKDLFHDVATQVTELAHQLAKQGELLQELQARLGKVYLTANGSESWRNPLTRDLSPGSPLCYGDNTWNPSPTTRLEEGF